MAALDFPSSPTNGQTYTANDTTWIYSTTLAKWEKAPRGYPLLVNATKAQMEAGTDDSAYVTALKATQGISTPKLWVNYDQVAIAIDGDFNTTSVTDTALGVFTVNYTNSMANSTYSPTVGFIMPAFSSNTMAMGLDGASASSPVLKSTSASRYRAQRSDGPEIDQAENQVSINGLLA